MLMTLPTKDHQCQHTVHNPVLTIQPYGLTTHRKQTAKLLECLEACKREKQGHTLGEALARPPLLLLLLLLLLLCQCQSQQQLLLLIISAP